MGTVFIIIAVNGKGYKVVSGKKCGRSGLFCTGGPDEAKSLREIPLLTTRYGTFVEGKCYC